MSNSKTEEIIAVLWAIAALLAFANGHQVWGWIFAVKAALDTACSIGIGIIEAIKEVKAARASNVKVSGPEGGLPPKGRARP
jgi:hypothetical protein